MRASDSSPLKIRDGTISQGTQAPSNSWKKKLIYPRTSRKEFSVAEYYPTILKINEYLKNNQYHKQKFGQNPLADSLQKKVYK